MIAAKKIWLNGRLLPWGLAKVHLMSHGLHYGSGVFEGLRSYSHARGSAVFRLTDHLARFVHSARVIGIKLPYRAVDLAQAVKQTIQANGLAEAYIRPLVFYGEGAIAPDAWGAAVSVAIIVIGRPNTNPAQGISAEISKFIRLHPLSINVEAKVCGYYANSLLAARAARRHGYEEAILLDYRGDVAEASGRNLFLVKRGKIYTPPLGNILPGITRASLIRFAPDLDLKVVEKKIKPAELVEADEIFLTGTATEITAVTRLGKKIIGDGRLGAITARLQTCYRQIVLGNIPRYTKWLTYVRI